MPQTRLAFVLWALAALPVCAEPRTEIDLNGTYRYLRVRQLDQPPEAGAWHAIEVPGTLRGYDYERAWFVRDFSLPETMRNKRIQIRFDGVKYNSRILVNGQHVGGCYNGYDAFEVDITDAVWFDRPNHLAVGVCDWTGVFSEGEFDFSDMPAWQRPRRYVSDKVIAPIGGHYDHYGIWGDVTLTAHPHVYVKDLFIRPSVRENTLTVQYTIANESLRQTSGRLDAAVVDGGDQVLSLPGLEFSLGPGESTTHALRQPWSTARHWSHEDPYLYHLQTTLSTGDELETRFGFREFWIEGHRYVLNGANVNLLASSWWPPTEPMTRDQVKQQWTALKAAGVNCFRTHTQPWRAVHYDVADEVGLLMIVEGAVWHDPYCTRYDDPRFWRNYAAMINAMIKREKNRPSVIMWSMGNEIYSDQQKTELAVPQLARLGRLAKTWDPTRPIYFESDGDPEGVADAIGMHYVHEYPKYTCWPNEAYWLDRPFSPRTWFGIEGENFLWTKQKPLYIGEFLWVPSGTPAAHSVFYGDEAYRDFQRYTRLAKADAWKMQILAFRHHEVGGMCPWTVGTDLDVSNPLYRAHQYAYQPIAVYCHDYDRRFYAGRKVSRRVEIFNDVLATSRLRFEWTLNNASVRIAQGTQSLELEPGEKRQLEIELPMPLVEQRTGVTWRLSLQREGRTVFDDSYHYCVFPRLELPQLANRVAIYDPSGETTRLLDTARVDYQLLEAIDHLDGDIDLLVIGDGALRKGARGLPVIGRVDPQRSALMEFVADGGRILILRQQEYPEGLFDVEPTLHKSTMTFPLHRSHPAMYRLEADDLKFWRGDHMVTDHELPRPASGAATSIIVSGSDTGIAYAPLLERPVGSGCMMHCQLKLIEKATTEPAAGVMLSNLLRYLDSYTPQSRKTGVVSSDGTYLLALRELGLRADNLTAGTHQENLADYSLIICHGDATISRSLAAGLAAFVREGGQLLIHRPSPALMERLGTALQIDLKLQPRTGTVSRAEGDHPLLEFVAREDLYWTEKRPGLSWAKQPLSRNMIDGVFGRAVQATPAETSEVVKNGASSPPREQRSLEVDKLPIRRDKRADELAFLTTPAAVVTREYGKGKLVFDAIRWDSEQSNGRKASRFACSLLTALGADFTPRPGVTLECEQMTPEPDMPHHSVDGSTAYLGSNGYIRTTIRVARSGRYEAVLFASGDNSEGIGPLVEVHVDGQKVSQVQLTTQGWRSYPLELDLAQGDHELSLCFVNDHYSPTGDRNLRLDKLVIHHDARP